MNRQLMNRNSGSWTRRQLLSAGMVAAPTMLVAPALALNSRPVIAAIGEKHLRVVDIQRTTVRLPFRDAPRRAMDRELPHWRYVEVFEVRLSSGVIGVGETLLYYTWGVSDDDDVRRAMGSNAADLMWDDSLGAGLQIALFDAVAKTCEVPLHRLLGHQRHQTTPLSWWNIDMPPNDMASECAEALRQGYTSYKTKGRPWFDLWQQVEEVSGAVPESFKLDIDFNDTLRDADRAIPILTRLEKNPRIDIYETPIPQNDVEGNRRLRAATRVSIALHYGSPPPAVANFPRRLRWIRGWRRRSSSNGAGRLFGRSGSAILAAAGGDGNHSGLLIAPWCCLQPRNLARCELPSAVQGRLAAIANRRQRRQSSNPYNTWPGTCT